MDDDHPARRVCNAPYSLSGASDLPVEVSSVGVGTATITLLWVARPPVEADRRAVWLAVYLFTRSAGVGVVGGGCTHYHAWPWSYDHRPSHPPAAVSPPCLSGEVLEACQN